MYIAQLFTRFYQSGSHLFHNIFCFFHRGYYNKNMNINQAFEILKSAGGIRAARIITQKRKKMSFFRVLWYAHLLRRGMPVAKIIHSKWFYGLDFYTNSNTLDPRPDTETLIESVIKDCQSTSPRRIIDLGTGTGCIICALCKNIPDLSGIAIDKSRAALRVAKRTVKKLNLKNKIKLKHSDFANFKSDEKFDIIVSNPPYIPKSDSKLMRRNVTEHEPSIALFVEDDDPLLFYRSIARTALRVLRSGGKLYFEIYENFATEMVDMLTTEGYSNIVVREDFRAKPRMICAEKR
jgi:release factor glutamine methyltransferase